jgi:hypothetical protein
MFVATISRVIDLTTSIATAALGTTTTKSYDDQQGQATNGSATKERERERENKNKRNSRMLKKPYHDEIRNEHGAIVFQR